ncbi:hypothetical protein NIES2101_39085 [Calothrix sp. HK-06]|nr:hypothetical protein NIES2101_39085 [Calothrix sp. HK-06]
MKNHSKDLVALEEILLAVQIVNSDNIGIVDVKATLDLDEFDLTPEEVDKFQKIFRRLNNKLAESLQKQHPACSVISEICFKQSE